MTVLERIKETCRKTRNISITTLEQELHYSNGSLSKVKDIPSSRILEIAKYLNVSMDFLMTGENPQISKEDALLDVQISEDIELKKAIEKYYSLDDRKKKHIIELIDLLSEE